MKRRLIALLLLISILFLHSCGGNTAGDSDTDINDGSSTDSDNSGDDNGGADGGDDEPDYGTATVYGNGSVVYFLGSVDEKMIIHPLVETLHEGGITVNSGSDTVEKLEITVGCSADRDITRKAYELLEYIPKTSYFNSRYLVYADSGKIAIAYDYNAYTPISCLDYICDKLIDSIIGKDGLVVLSQGVVAYGSVDLIAEQEKLDEKALDEAWAKLEKKVPAEIYEAFRTLYTLYDDELISWYANLYDPNVGAYYSTTSQKEKECYFPGPEVTIQALRFLESSGMLSGLGKYRDNIPKLMRYSIVYYCKSIQDPNGYFYDPQYEKHSASGRDLSWCTDMLRQF